MEQIKRPNRVFEKKVKIQFKRKDTYLYKKYKSKFEKKEGVKISVATSSETKISLIAQKLKHSAQTQS